MCVFLFSRNFCMWHAIAHKNKCTQVFLISKTFSVSLWIRWLWSELVWHKKHLFSIVDRERWHLKYTVNQRHTKNVNEIVTHNYLEIVSNNRGIVFGVQHRCNQLIDESWPISNNVYFTNTNCWIFFFSSAKRTIFQAQSKKFKMLCDNFWNTLITH